MAKFDEKRGFLDRSKNVTPATVPGPVLSHCHPGFIPGPVFSRCHPVLRHGIGFYPLSPQPMVTGPVHRAYRSVAEVCRAVFSSLFFTIVSIALERTFL